MFCCSQEIDSKNCANCIRQFDVANCKDPCSVTLEEEKSLDTESIDDGNSGRWVETRRLGLKDLFREHQLLISNNMYLLWS